jgi:glucose/arabinose dehydrogenase
MRGRRTITLLALSALVALGAALPGAAGARVGLKRVGSFDRPVYVTGPPRAPKLLYVVEQPGRIDVVRHGRHLRRPFLDIRSLVGFDFGEEGLLSMALPPKYPKVKRFYVYYTNNQGNIQVDEFRRGSRTRARRGTRRKVIEIPHPSFANHNGGQLQFHRNLLYLGTGDGGSGGEPRNNAQDTSRLLGKLIRIDPRNPPGRSRFRVPASNPFVGRRGRDLIFAYGLRNPFRFSFDTISGSRPRIVIGDVGQYAFEEVDYERLGAASGANFGWDAWEGFSLYNDDWSGTPDPGGTTKPIFTYGHGRGCAIIGGYVVRDRRLRGLRGRYVYTDNCNGTLRSLSPHLRRAGGDRSLGISLPQPTSFGEDGRGRLYVTTLTRAAHGGKVFRLVRRR